MGKISSGMINHYDQGVNHFAIRPSSVAFKATSLQELNFLIMKLIFFTKLLP